MTQSDVIDFLSKNPEEWFTATELANALKINQVNRNLRQLRLYGMIQSDHQLKENSTARVWKYKYKPEIMQK